MKKKSEKSNGLDIIKTFFIDWDDAPIGSVLDDISMIVKEMRGATVKLYATGTKNHHSGVVENITISFDDSIRVLCKTACSRCYITMAIVRRAHYFRFSERIEISKCGITFTKKPEYKGTYYLDSEVDGVAIDLRDIGGIP